MFLLATVQVFFRIVIKISIFEVRGGYPFQPAWFKQWPWISYDQEHDRAFCFCCVQAVRQEKVRA